MHSASLRSGTENEVDTVKPVKHIVDTTMRDGEQSPGMAMTMEQKLLIAQKLDSAGIYQIEAGIPAMGSYEIETISRMMQARKHAKISAWNRLKIEDIKKSLECKPDIIHFSVPVSYIQIYSKLNKNKSWVSKNLAICAEFALGHGYEVTVGFEDASRADITFMAALAGQLMRLGVIRIRFADTVGVLSPSRTYQAIKDIIGYSGIAVEFHAHNDLGMAVANSVMAAKAGSDYLDTTIMGIGERAGNCDLYQLTNAIHDIYDIGISKRDAFRLQCEIAAEIPIPL